MSVLNQCAHPDHVVLDLTPKQIPVWGKHVWTYMKNTLLAITLLSVSPNPMAVPKLK